MKAYKLVKVSYDWSAPSGQELYEEELGAFSDMPSYPAHKKIAEHLKSMGPQVLFVAFGFLTPEVYPQFRIEEVKVK